MRAQAKKLYDEEASRPAQAYDLGGVSTWFFEVDSHSLCARAYLSVLYAVVKGQARGASRTETTTTSPGNGTDDTTVHTENEPQQGLARAKPL